MTKKFLKEWSRAPSIFNIEAQGLAHCLYWMKLSHNEVYWVYFNELDLILLSRKKIILLPWFFYNLSSALPLPALLLYAA